MFATFALTGTKWPGDTAVQADSQQRLHQQAHRVREPAARDQPLVHLRVPGLRRVAGGDADRDLRGAGRRAGSSPGRCGEPRPARLAAGFAGAGLAAAGRAGDARPRSGSSTMPYAPLRTSAPRWIEVPVAAPGNEGRHTERVRDSAFPVNDPRSGDVPVADAVVAGADGNPLRVLGRDDDLDERRVRPDELVDRGQVEGEVVPEPALPVRLRVGDGLDLLVGLLGEERGQSVVRVAGGDRQPDVVDGVAEGRASWSPGGRWSAGERPAFAGPTGRADGCGGAGLRLGLRLWASRWDCAMPCG